MNKFEWVKDSVVKDLDGKLPARSTKHSAGYDFFAPFDFTIDPHSATKLHFTDVKVRLDSDSVLLLFPRSSLGCKGIMLANTVGIIDADYYGNPKNDGNIGFMLVNKSDEVVEIKKGDKFMQGIIVKYDITDDDNVSAEREGGFGSTN